MHRAVIDRVLASVYRVIAAYLIRQRGYTQHSACTGAVTRATSPVQGFLPSGQTGLAFPPAPIQRSNGKRAVFPPAKEARL